MKKANSLFTLLILFIVAFSACCKSSQQINVEAQVNEKLFQNNGNVNSNINAKEFIVTDSTIPIVKPSNLLEVLRKKMTGSPNMTAKQLADFGNDFIKKFGYDFTFDWSPKGKENEETYAKLDYENFYPFTYQFTDLSGKPRKFQLMNDIFGSPCFSVIDVPVTKVNEQMMTIISDGKEIELKRPKDFDSEEIILVDASKKPIRKWKTPIDATPVGISEDGKKIYFDSYQFYQDANNDGKESKIGVAVEVSEDGSLKLVDSGEIKSGEGVDVDHDKQYTEITFRKYKVGNTEYIVKFSYPCT